ncbi:hypothetical protein ACJ41O_012773 [Fusarium nematophilum]
MRTIAVAGGTGGVGKSIVDGLVAYGKHKVFVLSRSDRHSQGYVNYLRVDYSDPNSLAEAFEQAGVNIVICAIGVATPEANQSQLNVIRAAERSSPTQRFVISSFDMLHVKEDTELSPLARYTFQAIDELEKTHLTYTRIANGWFLDYYGMPVWKTHLHPWINVMNMEKKWAVIPGDGTTKASFITTQDMARFVARLMDLETWSKISPIIAQTLTFDELVELAEKSRGCKFQVAYDRFGDGDQAFFAMIHYQAGLGRYLVPTENALDVEFPDIKTTSALEVMETGWKGK